MITETNFIVRKSGRMENRYYIDYQGVYKICQIAKITAIMSPILREKYLGNNAVYDEELDIFYFNSVDKANDTISDILKTAKLQNKGKLIFLAESEIEYIGQALINEGVNTIHVGNKVKDNIFKKLND